MNRQLECRMMSVTGPKPEEKSSAEQTLEDIQSNMDQMESMWKGNSSQTRSSSVVTSGADDVSEDILYETPAPWLQAQKVHIQSPQNISPDESQNMNVESENKNSDDAEDEDEDYRISTDIVENSSHDPIHQIEEDLSYGRQALIDVKK